MNNKLRSQIPKPLKKQLLDANAGVCCVCRTRRLGLNFHHIDSDPANNDPSNIAVLCVREHDTHHRPAQYHFNLSAEQIAAAKREWERFIDEARKPHPSVIATFNAYGSSVDHVHSMRLVLQWVGHGIVLERIYHLLNGPPSKWVDDIFDELRWLGAGIQVALIDQLLPVEYCPAEGHAYSQTVNLNFATRLVSADWSEESACGVYINPGEPSLGISISYRGTDIETASLHRCGNDLHFHCEAFDECIRIKRRPSIRSQARKMVDNFLRDWSPGKTSYGTGNHDDPVLIECLDLPGVWEEH